MTVHGPRRVALANEAIEYAVNQLNVEREDATVGMTRLSAAVLGAGGTIETAALAFLGTTKAIKATKLSQELEQSLREEKVEKKNAGWYR